MTLSKGTDKVKKINDDEECVSRIQFADQAFLHLFPLSRTSKLCVQVCSRWWSIEWFLRISHGMGHDAIRRRTETLLSVFLYNHSRNVAYCWLVLSVKYDAWWGSRWWRHVTSAGTHTIGRQCRLSFSLFSLPPATQARLPIKPAPSLLCAEYLRRHFQDRRDPKSEPHQRSMEQRRTDAPWRQCRSYHQRMSKLFDP